MIKTDGTYQENEISKILRDSEEASVSEDDRGEGHSEGLHELQAQGRRRNNATIETLEERILGPEMKTRVGAFDGCQVKAVTHALNSKAGRTALGYLSWATCEYVFVTINIVAGGFRMTELSIDVTTPAPSGATFVVSPTGVALPGFLVPTQRVTKLIGMKLMKFVALKYDSKSLHIRTAFPIADGPDQSRVEIHWARGGIDVQDLPA
jgi:hypothetical protein